MQKIKFEFINKEIKFKTDLIRKRTGENYLTSILYRGGYLLPNETDDEAFERVMKLIKNNEWFLSKHCKDLLTDDQIKERLVLIEHPKPNQYPKFNNETPFTAFNGRYVNPEIIAIRWVGPWQTWEYQMKNVGHIGDYYDEEYLKEYELCKNKN